jgi:tRNA dimethylallyltransferase
MSAAHRLLPEGAPPPLAIVGTTASGKSALAMAIARRRGDVELVSVDSMQVYRGMDIGTAKPTAADQAEVRHHVIDLVEPWETFEVHSFQRAVAKALADIATRDHRAVLVGGTGLYLQAVIDGFEIPGQFPEVAAELEAEDDTVALHARLVELDPLAASRMEPTNRRRVVRALEVTLGSGRPFSSYGPGVGTRSESPILQLGIRLPQPVVADRIEARYAQQVAAGFLAEVERLADGPPLSRTAAQALGYRELLRHLEAQRAGETEPTFDDALDEAIRRTRAFARRQRAWFRRDHRITWFDADLDPAHQISDILEAADRHWP